VQHPYWQCHPLWFPGPFKSLRLVARADPQQIIDNFAAGFGNSYGVFDVRSSFVSSEGHVLDDFPPVGLSAGAFLGFDGL
tara:strand:- start:366 stop:605 length:240 start_codon:yes stop_codon:yes gene_type:complete